MKWRIALTLKRAFDIVVSLTVLILLAPLMALIAPASKLNDGGPGLYVDKRASKDRKTINFFRFQSMVVGADRIGLGRAVAEDDRSMLRDMWTCVRSMNACCISWKT